MIHKIPKGKSVRLSVEIDGTCVETEPFTFNHDFTCADISVRLGSEFHDPILQCVKKYCEEHGIVPIQEPSNPWNNGQSDRTIDNLDFRLTCLACPEQYDVFVAGTDTQVGYVRLRHGDLYADCPECGGETVYSNENMDDDYGDGMFATAEIRVAYLTRIAGRINEWRSRNP